MDNSDKNNVVVLILEDHDKALDMLTDSLK